MGHALKTICADDCGVGSLAAVSINVGWCNCRQMPCGKPTDCDSLQEKGPKGRINRARMGEMNYNAKTDPSRRRRRKRGGGLFAA